MPQTNQSRYFISIVVLSILTVGLFILSIFIVILPRFEKTILDGKKEMISELTQSVCSLIEEYHQEAETFQISLDSAQTMALERVRKMRYGHELKDYFWIIDMHPNMIMHPYRPELVGSELNDYKDPNGKLLFVESVNTVTEEGEGFIDYMWQWKDDSTQIVPKLSYVKAFEPWNWIVGTGIYLEDVQIEIGQLRARLLRMALWMSFILGTFLAFITRQSLGIEKRRRSAENKLRQSREKYITLVQASTEGTLMMVDQSFAFSNLKFSKLSGYDPAEVREMDFENLFDLKWSTLVSAFKDPKKSVSYEITLTCKDRSIKEVVITASRINHAKQTTYILIIKEFSSQMQYKKDGTLLSRELQNSLQMMNQPLISLALDILRYPASTTVRDAARIMARKNRNVLFISHEDEIIGLITNNDLNRRVLATGLDPETRVIEIMTSPIAKLPEKALIYEGLLFMKRERISHIALPGKDRKIGMVVGYEDILRMQQNLLGFMISEIESAEEVSQISRIYQRLPVLIQALIESGSNTSNLTEIISSMGDAIHKRLIEIALEDLGPAPINFAFMVMGSQARGEQTLVTDQDNAIVIDNDSGKLSKKDQAFFLELGKKLNNDLNTVGYKFCPGEIMAGNPRWNQDLNTWKAYFSSWISGSQPKDILDLTIFLDFRCIYGDSDLVEKLRDHVNHSAEGKSVFFYHLAQPILKMKFMPNLPGNLKAASHSDTQVDIKMALLMVQSFIRLYAIREKLESNNSIERAEKLHKMSVISASTLQEFSEPFDFLTYLRIKNQAYSISRNEAPGNTIRLGQLSHIEALTLKKIYTDIASLQSSLGSVYSRAD
ncbi:MAG: CBS domain-containing protein [Bacteroidetes bacterium]|nr:CBS domain-containing protein [Bacteroidota bacterium]